MGYFPTHRSWRPRHVISSGCHRLAQKQRKRQNEKEKTKKRKEKEREGKKRKAKTSIIMTPLTIAFQHKQSRAEVTAGAVASGSPGCHFGSRSLHPGRGTTSDSLSAWWKEFRNKYTYQHRFCPMGCWGPVQGRILQGRPSGQSIKA